MRHGELVFHAWSEGLLADSYLPDAGGLLAEPRPVRLPPRLHADPEGTLWLLDRCGTVVRGGKSTWERVDAVGSGIVGLAPQPGGGAVAVSRSGEGFELVSHARDGRVDWRHSLRAIAAKHPRLGGAAPPLVLQDERGTAYLHVKAPPSAVFGVDAATGDVHVVAELGTYDAPVLVWKGAVWSIRFDGTRRLWLRVPFGGIQEVVRAGGALDDTFLTAVAVCPDGSPVLTDGSRLLAVPHSLEERRIALPALRPPVTPGPAVLDLLRPVARPSGELWMVQADGAGWSVHAVPVAGGPLAGAPLES